MTGEQVRLFGEVFVTLFVIMDPPGTIPLFLSLTSGRTAAMRRRIAWQASTVALAVIVLFAIFGQQILDYLSISLPALQAAGGLLLLLVALELLTGKSDEPAQTQDVNVALVPLGTPLLAGPGAIVATMVFVQRADGSLPDVVADNSSSSLFVLGTTERPPRELELARLEMVMEVNGERVQAARSDAISGDPLLSVVQLCELLEARGESLPAGSIVLAGAATAAHMLRPGDRVRLTVEGLGEVSVSVESDLGGR